MNRTYLLLIILTVVVFLLILWNCRYKYYPSKGGGSGGHKKPPTSNPPSAPNLRNVLEITDTTSYTVTWDAPFGSSNAPVTGYVIVQMLSTNKNSWYSVGQAASNATSYTVVGKTKPGDTYAVSMYATSTSGNSDYAVPIDVTIASQQPPPITSPDAPTQLSASSIKTTSFVVNWTLAQGGDVASTATILISPKGALHYAPVHTVKASALSVTIDGLAPSTAYDTVVYTSNSAGNSENSNVISTTTTATPPVVVVPNPPTLVSTKPLSSTSYSVSWSAPMTGPKPTGYTVYDRIDGTVTYALAGTSTSLSAIVTDLVPGDEYDVVVYATNSSGSSVASDMETVQLPDALLPPSTPVISSLIGSSSTTYTLTWIDNPSTDQITEYLVQQSTDGTHYTTVDTASPSDIDYTSGQLATNTTYYVKLVAVNAAGDSDPSAPLSVGLVMLPSTPDAPVLTQVTDTSYSIDWSASSDATGYLVQESTDGINFTTIYTDTDDLLSYTAANRVNGDTYYVQIIAINNDGDSQPSPFSNITLEEMELYPTPPTGLTFTRDYKSGNYSLYTLAWDSNPSAEDTTSYNIYTTENNGQFELANTVDAPITSFQGYANDQTDNFQVYITSVNVHGESHPSPTIDAEMLPLPSNVTGVAVVGNQDQTGFTVTWSSNPPQDEVIQYNIGVCIEGDNAPVICGCWSPNPSGSCIVSNSRDPQNSFDITADNFPSSLGTFDLGSTYDVYVFAQNATGDSTSATPVTTTVAYPPQPPYYYPGSGNGNYGPTIGQIDKQSFYFSWDPAPNGYSATSYIITYEDFVSHAKGTYTVSASAAVNKTSTGYTCKAIVTLANVVTDLMILMVSAQGMNSAGVGQAGEQLNVLMVPVPLAPSDFVVNPDSVNPVYTATWSETLFPDPNDLMSIIQNTWNEDPNYMPLPNIIGYYIRDKTISGNDKYVTVATVDAVNDATSGDGLNTPYTYAEAVTASYGTDYDVVVIPYNITGNGVGSKALTADVAPMQAVPPTSVSATSTLPGTIDVTWTPSVPDYATSYIIEYELNSASNSWVQVDTKGITTSFTVSGIDAGSTGGAEYAVRVSASNSAGHNSSNYITVLVMPSSPPPEPDDLGIINITTNSYTATVYSDMDPTDYDDCAMTFVFQHSLTGQNKWVTDAAVYSPPTLDGGEPEASTTVTTSLVVGATYDIRVYATNAAGTAGAPTPIQTIQLLQPNKAPDTPSFDEVTAGTVSIDVYIDYPSPNKGGEADTFVVQYQPVGGKWTQGINVDPSSGYGSLQGLVPGTKYNLRVSAINNSGSKPLQSVWSSITSTATLFYGSDCSGASQTSPGTCVINASGNGAYLDMVECGKGCTNTGNTSPMTVTFTVNGDDVNGAPAYQLYRWNGSDPGPSTGVAPSTPLLTTVNQPAEGMPIGSLQGTFDGTQFPEDWYEGATVCAWMCSDNSCSDLTPTPSGGGRGSPCWSVPTATSSGANYNPGFGGFPIPGM